MNLLNTLETERDFACFGVYIEHLERFLLIQLEDFLWIHTVVIAHFTDVHKRFDA